MSLIANLLGVAYRNESDGYHAVSSILGSAVSRLTVALNAGEPIKPRLLLRFLGIMAALGSVNALVVLNVMQSLVKRASELATLYKSTESYLHRREALFLCYMVLSTLPWMVNTPGSPLANLGLMEPGVGIQVGLLLSEISSILDKGIEPVQNEIFSFASEKYSSENIDGWVDAFPDTVEDLDMNIDALRCPPCRFLLRAIQEALSTPVETFLSTPDMQSEEDMGNAMDVQKESSPTPAKHVEILSIAAIKDMMFTNPSIISRLAVQSISRPQDDPLVANLLRSTKPKDTKAANTDSTETGDNDENMDDDEPMVGKKRSRQEAISVSPITLPLLVISSGDSETKYSLASTVTYGAPELPHVETVSKWYIRPTFAIAGYGGLSDAPLVRETFKINKSNTLALWALRDVIHDAMVLFHPFVTSATTHLLRLFVGPTATSYNYIDPLPLVIEAAIVQSILPSGLPTGISPAYHTRLLSVLLKTRDISQFTYTIISLSAKIMMKYMPVLDKRIVQNFAAFFASFATQSNFPWEKESWIVDLGTDEELHGTRAKFIVLLLHLLLSHCEPQHVTHVVHSLPAALQHLAPTSTLEAPYSVFAEYPDSEDLSVLVSLFNEVSALLSAKASTEELVEAVNNFVANNEVSLPTGPQKLQPTHAFFVVIVAIFFYARRHLLDVETLCDRYHTLFTDSSPYVQISGAAGAPVDVMSQASVLDYTCSADTIRAHVILTALEHVWSESPSSFFALASELTFQNIVKYEDIARFSIRPILGFAYAGTEVESDQDNRPAAFMEVFLTVPDPTVPNYLALQLIERLRNPFNWNIIQSSIQSAIDDAHLAGVEVRLATDKGIEDPDSFYAKSREEQEEDLVALKDTYRRKVESRDNCLRTVVNVLLSGIRALQSAFQSILKEEGRAAAIQSPEAEALRTFTAMVGSVLPHLAKFFSSDELHDITLGALSNSTSLLASLHISEADYAEEEQGYPNLSHDIAAEISKAIRFAERQTRLVVPNVLTRDALAPPSVEGDLDQYVLPPSEDGTDL